MTPTQRKTKMKNLNEGDQAFHKMFGEIVTILWAQKHMGDVTYKVQGNKRHGNGGVYWVTSNDIS